MIITKSSENWIKFNQSLNLSITVNISLEEDIAASFDKYGL